jgi:hypothetical protein
MVSRRPDGYFCRREQFTQNMLSSWMITLRRDGWVARRCGPRSKDQGFALPVLICTCSPATRPFTGQTLSPI